MLAYNNDLSFAVSPAAMAVCVLTVLDVLTAVVQSILL